VATTSNLIPGPADTPLLIKPFTAQVQSNGIAIVTVTQSNHGLAWVIYQIGLALNQSAPSPQVAAHVNGIPLAATVTMQNSAFAALTGQAPYAMESFFVGPPYVNLEAGDQLVVAVTGANSGDMFTVGAYINEIVSPSAIAARFGYAR
jgi:hypothetical protein